MLARILGSTISSSSLRSDIEKRRSRQPPSWPRSAIENKGLSLRRCYKDHPTQSAALDIFRNQKCRETPKVTARNLLLEERSRKPEIGGTHGGERGFGCSWISYRDFIDGPDR